VMKLTISKPTVLASLLLFASTLAIPRPAVSAEAVTAEHGLDVGDGQVLYDIPYNPKQVREVAFVSPTVNHPFYEIVVPLGDWAEGESATVKKVTVNGVESDSFYLFVDGFSHVQSGWITQKSKSAKNVVLVTRSLWHNGEAITIDVEISTAGAPQSIVKTFQTTAPKAGGGPTGWRRYQSLVLSEIAGLPRNNEPVEFSLAVRAEDCADLERELSLFAVDSGEFTPLPLQTFNPKQFAGTPPGTSNQNYLQHPSRSLEGIFLASVPANSARVFVFVYDRAAGVARPSFASDLAVSGPPVGATIENHFYKVKLSEKCGQIASFDLKGRQEKPVPRLSNSSSYAVHWNPDSFSDNGQWGHTFGWNPPDRTTV